VSPWGSLQHRDLHTVEEMDKADCDPQRLNKTYARFPVVNRLLSGWRATYSTYMRPLFAEKGAATLLDIGCGSGDVARNLARWAQRDGLSLDVTAIDPDGRAYLYASQATPVAGVTYRQAHSSELVAEGMTFDVVMSNHILHHLDDGQLAEVLRDSEALCRGVALHNDLNRSNLAYLLFAAGFWPLGVGSYICGDGLVSIKRSYTASELETTVPENWSVEGNGPWHNLLVHRHRKPADLREDRA
jgi:2-polyprenyl-3-methyl-5-hydroxy-6-metoxy-1,4-benzoquinol methylase